MFSERRFVWIIPAYIIPLALHYYIKGTLVPFYSNAVFNNDTLTGILVGSNNLGSMLGAIIVYLFNSKIPSSIPWVRFSAIVLNFLWIFPYLYIDPPETWVGVAVPFLVMVGAGYAAGDVMLTAYLQASVSTLRTKAPQGLSALSSVVVFLYSCYLVLYTTLNISMGAVFNSYGNPKDAMVWLGGVVVILLGSIVFAATFIPKNGCSVNPKEDRESHVAPFTTMEREEEFAIVF